MVVLKLQSPHSVKGIVGCNSVGLYRKTITMVKLAQMAWTKEGSVILYAMNCSIVISIRMSINQ